MVELYDKFFRNAFPKMTERLGIVYTPVEVVDFIIHSVAHLLRAEFGQSLGSKGVHIIDPFTGTGTFVTRLLQSGLIKPEELPHKYRHEIHANEIVLLAYYIAAINIEAVYHGLVGGAYQPFEGICLTDTFQMYEKEDLVDALLVDNSSRRKRQKKLDIRVIIGNPPYSVGQGDANANNANVAYPSLDSRIRETYASRSGATNKNSLYDSYIRSIRWASDRIGDAGIIGFVTNAGFIDSRTSDGLRKCLADEFSDIYVFHLRGLRGQKTAGERAKKEGGQIFGAGSSAAIAISLLVKNPSSSERGRIHFHDIGDYLSREEKLGRVAEFKSVAGIDSWRAIEPDEHGDWLRQRDDTFSSFLALGQKGSSNKAQLFEIYSRGLETGRDAWVFGSSRFGLESRIRRFIGFYNSEVDRLLEATPGRDKKYRVEMIEDFIDTDSSKISWTRGLRMDCAAGKKASFNDGGFSVSLYRPFTKQHVYFDRMLNAYVNQLPRIFPSTDAENLVICLSAGGDKVPFSCLVSRHIPSLHFVDIEGSQCFPLYVYSAESNPQSSGTLFGEGASRQDRRYALGDDGMAWFRSAYADQVLAEEDVFYYAYGIFHSNAYRERYADNLAKELPRIPRVKLASDFWAFSRAGRNLAELHLDYETAPMFDGAKIDSGGKALTDADYRVEKMRFGKSGKDKDRTTIQYNNKITVTGIPLEAYDYVVNGKPAIEWVMERQCVKTDKDSGIVNDANDWAIETMGNPRYPLELLLRVVTVSLETMKIVRALPALDIRDDG